VNSKWKRRLRGLQGKLKEAEREMRLLGFSGREIDAMAAVEIAKWPYQFRERKRLRA
jgi:hypothetical protein